MTRGNLLKAGMGLGFAAMVAAVLVSAISQASPAHIRITLPVDSTSFDEGLDVRDASGRPVVSSSAKQQLRALFVGSMFLLLTRPELPRVAEVLASLRKFWNTAQVGFTQGAAMVWAAAIDLWAPSTKRSNLIPLLFLVSAFVLSSLCFSRSPAFAPGLASRLCSLSSTVIRC